MLVTGANGAGKTNLLEALHVGTQGFSPADALGRAADPPRRRRGPRRARPATAATVAGRRRAVALSVREPKRARLNGAPLRSAEQLRGELATLVFTPDRLVVVKGGPAARRAYFDRALGRLYPGAGARCPIEYAAAVGQRNAALRRVAAGALRREALAPWTAQVADLGATLVAARRDAIDAARSRASPSAPASSASPDARSATTPSRRPSTALEARLDARPRARRDRARPAPATRSASRRATATCGRSARRASSGSPCSRSCSPRRELLADAARRAAAPAARRRALRARREPPPDPERADRRVGQTIVTATGAAALPLAPAQLLVVTPGQVRGRADGAARRRGPARPARRRRAGRGRARGGDPRAGRPPSATRSRAPPGRCGSSRDGTLHVATRLVDVGVRARPARRGDPRAARRRARRRRADGAPLRPGPVPAPAARRRRRRSPAPPEPTPEDAACWPTS